MPSHICENNNNYVSFRISPFCPQATFLVRVHMAAVLPPGASVETTSPSVVHPYLEQRILMTYNTRQYTRTAMLCKN